MQQLFDNRKPTSPRKNPLLETVNLETAFKIGGKVLGRVTELHVQNSSSFDVPFTDSTEFTIQNGETDHGTQVSIVFRPVLLSKLF